MNKLHVMSIVLLYTVIPLKCDGMEDSRDFQYVLSDARTISSSRLLWGGASMRRFPELLLWN